MFEKFVNDWLEEGYTNFSGVKNRIRRENTMIPIVSDDKGNIQTPKPLFTSFLREVNLEPHFLPKYLTKFENKFRRINTINLEDQISQEMLAESPSAEITCDNRIIIEYDRKSIFLSRVMFNLFEIPDSSVPKGSPAYPKAVEKNELYQNALERHRNFPEEFVEKYIQTDFIDLEEKQIETIPMIFEHKSCMINNYLVKEHYNRSEMKVKAPPKLFHEFFDSKIKFADYTEFLTSIDNQPEFLERLSNALYVIEKTLDYNTYKNSILKYNYCETDIASDLASKDVNDSEDKESNDGTSRRDRNEPESNPIVIQHHLGFYFKELKNDFEVTCLECSPFNPNIFVVGYGVSKYKEMDIEYRGLVLCWNVHKCGYPEKIYKTEEVVTSLEFSKSVPFLVAVGMRYGLISLFYLNSSESGNVENFSSKIKPTGAIKSIRWVKKEYSSGIEIDMLLTASMDGLLCFWTCGKDIVGKVFRSIKRGENIADQGRRLVVATDAAGMCMELKPNNNEIVLIGTIEGEVLQARIDDSDSYKFVYKCHNGPVYDLQWSTLVTDVFITTGSDRDIHIWQVGKKKPSKSLNLDEVVLKVVWSSVKSTLFAAMCKKKILVFDLSVDLHKAVAEYEANAAVSFTFLSFCPENNWILVGQSNGHIELNELTNVSNLEQDQEEALKNTFLS